MSGEHFDVVIVGAGLSGIGAAYHLQTRLPHKRVIIFESRDAIGGTWDLFRYPGVRSDSDMFTLGYAFRPWLGAKSIADGPSILAYIRDTAASAELDRKIRFRHLVRRASWSGVTSSWTLDVSDDGRPTLVTCGLLFMCGGYYDYARGHTPAISGRDRFQGIVVHPQFWPESLQCEGRRVVVIGSGATAVTLVPELATRGAHVTMLQRSPSYVLPMPTTDRFVRAARRLLPARAAYGLVRARNILVGLLFYLFARRRPIRAKAYLARIARKALGPHFDLETHFAPRYNPWDQRLCIIPDGDLFKVLRDGTAEVVTGTIDTLTEQGVRLASGRDLPADIVVTATGLNLKIMGGVAIEVDGQAVDLATTTSYKGSMLSGIPNFVYALGYTNASWTLKCDLTSVWACRLLDHMDRHGWTACVPKRDPDMATLPLIDFTSGYVMRMLDRLPRQGARKPWRLNQNYFLDAASLRFGSIDDGVLTFARRGAPSLDPVGERVTAS